MHRRFVHSTFFLLALWSVSALAAETDESEVPSDADAEPAEAGEGEPSPFEELSETPLDPLEPDVAAIVDAEAPDADGWHAKLPDWLELDSERGS